MGIGQKLRDKFSRKSRRTKASTISVHAPSITPSTVTTVASAETNQSREPNSTAHYEIPVKKKFFISPSAKTLYTVRSGRTTSTLDTRDQGQLTATPANSASTTSSSLTKKADEEHAAQPSTSAGAIAEAAAPLAGAEPPTVPVAKEVSALAAAPAPAMAMPLVPDHTTANPPPVSTTPAPPILLTQPVSATPNTALGREEALARQRATSPSSVNGQKAKVYPASNGSFEEALPRSQKQEDHSYPPAAAPIGAPAPPPVGEEKSRDMASSGTKAKYMAKAMMWWAEFKMKHSLKKPQA